MLQVNQFILKSSTAYHGVFTVSFIIHRYDLLIY